MPRHSYRIAPLLFVSGLCALIYQVAWLRELRLVFGASTPASAAVLAVFMAGLGAGSLVLGKRADRAARPLKLYAHLEAGIAVTAALSPLLLMATRAGYVALGGSTTLGSFGGTLVRLLLAAIVLLPPTVLMGGTLPAAARAAIGGADQSRRTTALLYGANTLGAVLGAALSTFLLLEIFGTRFTLWMGCAVNGLIAIVARVVDRSLPVGGGGAGESSSSSAASTAGPAERAPLPASVRPFVLAAAAAVGFVFLLMELVWYRMLSPLLGGTTYTFGLILALALAGIGLGGVAYTLRAPRAVRLSTFAFSCVLEAALLALPYALGDRIAFLALFLRGFGALGLSGYVLGWTVVTAVVVLPASLVAGYQFPLLIALLGKGKRRVGRHVGLAYAFNTGGAIVGSLLGGFLLLPRLTAPGAWRYCAFLLVLIAAVAAALHFRRVHSAGDPWRGWIAHGLVAATALWLVVGTLGPTAVWRHSPIGAGRATAWVQNATRNSLKQTIYERRRAISWEAEGRESSIALYTLNDTSFLVNGKSDGAAVLDGGTQVMGGLLGALLHPATVHEALVIGLGTGSTAGWLGQLPTAERIDVVELEPAILDVARICSPVNASVMDNPRVHIAIGDAREVLLTTPRRYDLIFSEPSNPYRAGIASLFTREFYEAVRKRLSPDGVFVQWVQAYEIDGQSVRTVYATLSAVFGSVESWRTKDSDLMLIARETDRPVYPAELRARIATEPFRGGLMAAWRVDSVEGVLSRYVARPSFARAVAEAAGPFAVNTDDRNLLEFAIARSLGRPDDFDVHALRAAAARRAEITPPLVYGEGEAEIDWADVQDEMIPAGLVQGSNPWKPQHPPMDEAKTHRYRALLAWQSSKAKRAIQEWEAQDRPPRNAVELMVMADSYAVEARDEAEPLIEQLREIQPIEAAAVTARLRWAKRQLPEVEAALRVAVEGYRSDPWPNNELMNRTISLAHALAKANDGLVVPMYELLGPKLNVDSVTYLRRALRVDIGMLATDPSLCVTAIEEHGPYVPWYRHFLAQRVECYRRAAHPNLARATADLAEYDANEGTVFGADLPAVKRAK